MNLELPLLRSSQSSSKTLQTSSTGSTITLVLLLLLAETQSYIGLATTDDKVEPIVVCTVPDRPKHRWRIMVWSASHIIQAFADMTDTPKSPGRYFESDRRPELLDSSSDEDEDKRKKMKTSRTLKSKFVNFRADPKMSPKALKVASC